MILSALKSSLSLELEYSEHACDCLRGLSPEVGTFVEEMLFLQYDVHEAKLPAMESL